MNWYVVLLRRKQSSNQYPNPWSAQWFTDKLDAIEFRAFLLTLYDTEEVRIAVIEDKGDVP